VVCNGAPEWFRGSSTHRLTLDSPPLTLGLTRAQGEQPVPIKGNKSQELLFRIETQVDNFLFEKK
jgi:hypothetical protein